MLLKPAQIATALSAGSILGTLIMVFLFPALHRRVGTLLIYRCSMSLDIVFICCYPIVYFIAQHYIPKHEHDKNDFGSFKDRNEGKEGGKGIFGVWEDVPVGIIVGIVVMLVVKALAGMTWGYAHCLLLCFNGLCFLNSDDPLLHHSRCNMILVTASAPSPRSLGTVNSMAQMAASLARAIGPPIYSYVHCLNVQSSHPLQKSSFFTIHYSFDFLVH